MKKKTSLYLLSVLLFMIIATVLSSCSKTSEFTPVFSVDSNGIYSGFDNVTEPVDLETAEEMGYVVIDGQRIVRNSDIWDHFLKESSKKNNSSLRLVYYLNNLSVHILDLFYDNGRYYLFDNTTEQQNTTGFKHLLKLEGTFGMPKKQTIAMVLADNENLTFDEYMTAMFSSSTEVIQSVQPSRLVMFLLPEN